MSKLPKTLEPGVYENIPAEDYHKAEGVSNSVLGLIEKSTGTVLAYRANPPEPTAAQTLGTLFHTFCLEPDMMPGIVCKPEGFTRARNADKEWLAEQDRNGVTVLDKAEWDFMHYARDNMFAHPFIKRLLSVESRRELSVFHRDDEGVLRK